MFFVHFPKMILSCTNHKSYHVSFISFIFGNGIFIKLWPESVAINISSQSNKMFLWVQGYFFPTLGWNIKPAKCCLDVRSTCLCVTTWQLNKHKHRGQTAALHIWYQLFTWTKWGKYLCWYTFPVTPVYILALFIRRWDKGGGDGRWGRLSVDDRGKQTYFPAHTDCHTLIASLCMIE